MPKKPLTKSNTASLYKVLEEIRDIRDIPKHNKGNIQQDNIQHQTKWRETQSNSTKIRNKTRLSTLHIYSI